MKILNLILLFLAFFSLMSARGERAGQSKDAASHVVVGEVTEVVKLGGGGGEHIEYRVRIQVEAVEKGKGPAKGQDFYARCFQSTPFKGSGSRPPGVSGHSGVPKVGDRVRVFTNDKKAIYEGVYPNWYDVLPKEDESPEERERGMKLIGGDLSLATNEVERFYALGSAARNGLREGKVKEAEALATELARLAPKYKQDWNYGNAIADANQVLGQIALSKGDVKEAKKHLLASADSKGSPQLDSFGPSFILARELAEKGERETVIAFLDSVARFWANPDDRTESNSKSIASEHLKQLESWKEQLRAGKVPDHPKWRQTE